MRARIALVGFVLVMLVVHGILGWMYPIVGDDWGQIMWDVRHDHHSSSARAFAFLVTHFTLSDAMAYVLAHARIVHAVVTPVIAVALVFGGFTLACRRLPRPDHWQDVLGIVLISALIWITQPRAGLAWFYRPYVAQQLYGAALAAWFLVPYRCGWTVRGWRIAPLMLAGLLAGTSTRQIGTAVLLAVGYALWRTPRGARARWMWLGFVAVLVGAAAGYADPPPIAFATVLRRSLEINMTLLNVPVREGGELVTLVLLLVLARIVLARVRPAEALLPLPDARESLRWFGVWFALSVFALFGPRYNETTLLPATLVLCIAALPYLLWVLSSRVLRLVVVGLAIGVHLVAWSRGFTRVVPLGQQYEQRMATLERAPAESVAVIEPYSRILPSFWFFGEDWAGASRQYYAIELFGVRDVDFAPTFRKQERNPGIDIQLESEGFTPAQLAAAHVPARWATELSTARSQFETFARRLRAVAGEGVARLVVRNVDFAERRGRPVHVAWYEHGVLTSPRVQRTNPDANNRQIVRIPPALAAKLPERYIVTAGKAEPANVQDGRFRMQPMVKDLIVTVACDPDHCLLADAFVPRF
ncbi:MAG: hypothetical protein H0X17_01415 [Deltaproteobacteria bacterium]|nr:hypothetical protein [Deltaproteobacteria bacterium]